MKDDAQLLYIAAGIVRFTEEPDAVIPQVRIRGGTGRQRPGLPDHPLHVAALFLRPPNPLPYGHLE